MSITKIGKLEAIFLMLIVITNKIILNLPKTIILKSGTSAWINVIYISVIAILFTLLIVKLFEKFKGYSIIDVSNYLGGGFLKTICGIIYILAFVLIASIVLRDFSETLKLIYYTNSPIIFIMLFFIIATVVGNKLGFKAIVKTNLIIMPLIILTILVILFSSFKNFVPERLFPILGYGVDETFFSGFSNLFAYSGLTYIFLIMPYLKDCTQFKKISVISTVISSIYLFLSVICLLLVFPYITLTEEPLSIYLLSRSLEFGRFFQRIDAIFILLFIMSCLSYLTISVFLILDIFKQITNIQDSKAMTYCVAVLLFGLALLPNNSLQVKFINSTVFKYYILYCVFGFSTLILIIANIKKKREEKKKQLL